ncbi:MAG: hypothetical protein WDM70_03760 [Nitrosomonadales bacterium]
MVDRTSTEIAPWTLVRSQRQILRAHQGAKNIMSAD